MLKVYSIYVIKNKINNKFYVGFTSNKNPYNRFNQHCYVSKNNIQRQLITKSIKKYGRSNFDFEVIYQSLDKNHCLKMESYFIKIYNSYYIYKSGYNMTLGGEGVRRIKRIYWQFNISSRKSVKQAANDKITIAKKKRWGKENGMFGKTHSDTTKRKISQSTSKSLTGKTYEEIHGISEGNRLKNLRSKNMKKLNKNQKGKNNKNSKRVCLVSPSKEKHIIHGQIKDFCKNNSLNVGNIINLLKGRRNEYKGWTGYYILN